MLPTRLRRTRSRRRSEDYSGRPPSPRLRRFARSMALVHALVFQKVFLNTQKLLFSGLVWDYAACGAAYLSTLLFSKLMEAVLPVSLHADECRLCTCSCVFFILAAHTNFVLALDVTLFVGFVLGSKFLWWPKRDAPTVATRASSAKPKSTITPSLLKDIALVSAAQHREYVKKDTGYRCYMNLECTSLGIACGRGEATLQTWTEVNSKRDFAVFHWRATSPTFTETSVVRIRCDSVANRLVPLPSDWKETLKVASLELAKHRFGKLQLHTMATVSATEHSSEISLSTNHRAIATLECTCLENLDLETVPRRALVPYVWRAQLGLYKSGAERLAEARVFDCMRELQTICLK